MNFAVHSNNDQQMIVCQTYQSIVQTIEDTNQNIYHVLNKHIHQKIISHHQLHHHNETI